MRGGEGRVEAVEKVKELKEKVKESKGSKRQETCKAPAMSTVSEFESTNDVGMAYIPGDALSRTVDPVAHELQERAGRIFALDLRFFPASPHKARQDVTEGTRLSATAEFGLFRQMNFLKARADDLRKGLKLDVPCPSRMDAIEELVGRATEIRNHLSLAFTNLAGSIARRFVNDVNPFDELASEASVTLLKAVERFDPEKGFRFSTYATHAIQRNLWRYVTRRYQRAARESTLSEPDMLVDSHRWTWARQRATTEAMFGVERMMQELSPRERRILCSRYGLVGSSSARTLKQIAREMGISRERVRQLEHRSLEKLRRMASRPEMDWLELA